MTHDLSDHDRNIYQLLYAGDSMQHTVWSIYISVVIGLTIFISSGAFPTDDILKFAAICLAYAGFALINLTSILKNIAQYNFFYDQLRQPRAFTRKSALWNTFLHLLFDVLLAGWLVFNTYLSVR